MTQAMDFNSDLGESYGWWVRGADEVMMTCISSANVACGFHAGDATVMRASVAGALAHGVAIGAHPGYPDLLGFGRRALTSPPPTPATTCCTSSAPWTVSFARPARGCGTSNRTERCTWPR